MSMEQNGNQNMANTLFCRNGCGFYGAQAFDGMCSKCYKDLKQVQPNQSPVAAVQSPTATPSSSRSSVLASAASGGSDDVDAVAAALSKSSITEMNRNSSSSNPNNDKLKEKTSEKRSGSLTPSPDASEVETGSPTVTIAKASTSADPNDETGENACLESDGTDGDKGKKPKKNRCMECRKKVGLTGFQCHCGKLFCSLHRYSDTHDCTFDFKEKGQEEIRKNNPVVKGEKIQKI